MGALIRAHDWSKSPIGHQDGWSLSLKTALGMLLHTGYPMYIAWGSQFTQFYNDAYRPILGASKHPAALGSSSADTFPEIWGFIGPMFRDVMSRGSASTFIDQLLALDRNSFLEECYFTFSYSAIWTEQGAVGGVLVTCLETTERVLRERRLKILRDVLEIRNKTGLPEICKAIAAVLRENPHDLPFVAFYAPSDRGPECLALTGLSHDDEALAELSGIAATLIGQARTSPSFSLHPVGPVSGKPGWLWPEPVESIVAAPITLVGSTDIPVFLLAGISPRLQFDSAYQDFVLAIARNAGNVLTEAAAYEHERKKAEQLAELDRTKTAFFSNISHEFRTPLTLMLGPIEELLASRPKADENSEKALLTVAHRNAVRLLKLVNALLDFSRIEAGRMRARFQPAALAELTSELASNFRSAIESAGLKLIVDCPPLSEPVFVDRDMWEKIVLNLLSNAFKFTFEGEIAVSVRAANGAAQLVVRDTGTGIDSTELPRLFERFHRVEGAKGRSFEGTGIGLALVQELVKLHGGEITVQSVLGQGSAFSVTIPFGSAHLPDQHVVLDGEPEISATARTQAFVDEALAWLPDARVAPKIGANSPDDPVTAHQTGKGRRIILADDNRDMRDYLTRLLQSQGYQVDAVSNGEAVLELAFADPPDVVVSDVMMPGLDGFDVLRKLRSDPRTADIPVILLSAQAGEESRLEGIHSGADDYLVKPFSARELFARVAANVQLAELRRDAAQAMRGEYLRIRRLFEQAPGFIAILSGPEHRFEFANRTYVSLAGPRALIGLAVRDAFPEVEGQGFFELLDHVYASGERFVGRETPLSLRDPSTGALRDLFIDFIYEPVIGPGGEVTGIFVEGYEVTERVAAQSALRNSEEQLRLATEAAEVGLWDVDMVKDTLYWPPRVKAMFGISPGVPVTMADFYAGLHPEDAAATAASYNAAIDPQRRGLYDVEYRTVGKEDGIIRWVAAKGRGVFSSDGRCVRVIGTAIDITRRKADEAKLKELNDILERRISDVLAERKLFADVVEGTDAAVEIVDANLRWMSVNKAAADRLEHLFGVRPAAGSSVLDLLASRPEYQSRIRALWSRALAGEEYTVTESFGESQHRRYYEMKFNALRDKTGRQIGAYQFAHDVTDRLLAQTRLAETEAALRQAQKLEAMGQLTGGVAHDFNNLLTPIIGGLDMLQRRGLGGEREQRQIAGALESAERAKILVQRLLAFSRRQPLQLRPVDVGALIRGMAELLGSTMGPQIRLVVDVTDNLPPARGDANQLEMAILNLSVNARDAMENGGVLRISARAAAVPARHPAKLPPGEYVCISVADNGAGMDEATLARAIEPFFSTKGIGKGTGLGLSMVHGLASQLGGALTISSQKMVGTNVELWLPVSDTPVYSTESSVPDSRFDAGAGTVLLVDDESAVRASAADMLAEMGFAVIEADSAERALKLLQDGLRVDVLVTDHLMPGMSGVDLAYSVRERWPKIKLLVISGFAEAEGLAPDLDRLTKPFRKSELAAALSRVGSMTSSAGN